MQIAEHDTAARVMIVAEIGNNHEGSIDLAMEMVRAAASAGVDAVKFQTFKTELFCSPSQPERFEKLRSFELTQDEFRDLADMAASCGVMFMSTPLDLESAKFLHPLVPAFKVASGDNDFFPLIDTLAESGKPLIISTGLLDLQQSKALQQYVLDRWAGTGREPGLTLLHCVCSYPVAPDQANLRAIPTMIKHLGPDVGYSDHTLGIDAAVAAVALGARIVEKHFTLDKNQSDFRDHQLSADPDDMRLLVERIRQTETLLGSGVKAPQPGEEKLRSAVRRSIVLRQDLQAGSLITEADLAWMRPSGGLPPGREAQVVGRTPSRPIKAGTPLVLDDLT